MTFHPHEIDYLNTSTLGRLATVAADGTAHNSPVGFSYNAELGTIDIGGFSMSKSQKYRNIATNPTVAFVVDDIASVDPWRVRCLEIRGVAEQAQVPARVAAETGDEMDTAIIRITPKRIIGFGIDRTDVPAHELKADARNV